MMTADLVIRNGKVVSPDSVIDASVAIKDGVVLSVGADATMPPARETLDAKGMHLLPGAIDDHVHFRDPGYPHKEDFASGTAAAAFGGVTTVFDMPNTIPPTGTPEILAAKHKMAAGKAHVDFGLYATARRGHHRARAGTRRKRASASSSTWATRSARSHRRRPVRCSNASRWWRRPASASRCMPRRTRSWCGASCACGMPAASIRSRISLRALRWSRSRP